MFSLCFTASSVSLRYSGDCGCLQDGPAPSETLWTHKFLSAHQSRCFHCCRQCSEQQCLCEDARTYTDTDMHMPLQKH